MKVDEFKRLEKAQLLHSKIQKAKIQLKNLETCTVVSINNSEKRVDNKMKKGTKISRTFFSIKSKDPFHKESLAFIEQFKEHIKNNIALLEKEFRNL